MYQKILVAMALDHGLSPVMLELARRMLSEGGEIHALHVVEAPYGMAQALEYENIVNDALKRTQALMKEKLANAPDVIPHMVQGHVERNILEYAKTHGVDCIIMGSHKPELVDFLLGSTAARVVRHAPCAVHVFRRT